MERVLDWKPFDYYSIVKIPQIGGGRKLPIETISTFKLDRTDSGGTRLQLYCKVNAPLPKRATQWIAKYVLRLTRTGKAFSNLAKALSQADNQA